MTSRAAWLLICAAAAAQICAETSRTQQQAVDGYYVTDPSADSCTRVVLE